MMDEKTRDEMCSSAEKEILERLDLIESQLAKLTQFVETAGVALEQFQSGGMGKMVAQMMGGMMGGRRSG